MTRAIAWSQRGRSCAGGCWLTVTRLNDELSPVGECSYQERVLATGCDPAFLRAIDQSRRSRSQSRSTRSPSIECAVRTITKCCRSDLWFASALRRMRAAVSILGRAVDRLRAFQRLALDEGSGTPVRLGCSFRSPRSPATRSGYCATWRARLATTNCGGQLSPGHFRSSSRSHQSCVLSRAPSVKPTSSLRRSGVAPISARMPLPRGVLVEPSSRPSGSGWLMLISALCGYS